MQKTKLYLDSMGAGRGVELIKLDINAISIEKCNVRTQGFSLCVVI